ncbi:SH3 domain-containing protein [Streptomyces sp. NPDC020719]|uniref:SH3 domain-containing protein n=1 Tax=Streptomyces sp. NPDC020719 TaxID=3154896 RepID=UPI0033D64C0B
MRTLTKAVLLTAATLTYLATPTVAATQPATHAVLAPADFNSCGYYANDTVNLRTGPGTRFNSIGLLQPKDSVRAHRASAHWYQVITDAKTRSGIPADTTGWVHSKYLTPSTCTQLD